MNWLTTGCARSRYQGADHRESHGIVSLNSVLPPAVRLDRGVARSYGVLRQQRGFAQNAIPPWCAFSLRCKTWNPPKNKNPAKPGKFSCSSKKRRFERSTCFGEALNPQAVLEQMFWCDRIEAWALQGFGFLLADQLRRRACDLGTAAGVEPLDQR